MNFSKANFIQLNNGLECPTFGLGTYLAKEGGECYKAVREALNIGYRHIDTAAYYENEEEIGRAIREAISGGVVSRDEIFLVTKLPGSCNQPSLVRMAMKKSLKLLGLDYVDLYLVHTPVSSVPKAGTEPGLEAAKDKDGNTLFADVSVSSVWAEMEKLVDDGLTRSIGVSNFNSEQITEVVKSCRIKPVTNQIECHPYLPQDKLRSFCHQHDIILTAYRPLGGQVPKPGKKELLKEQVAHKIAQKHGKSVVQVLLRWHFEGGKKQLVLAKASNLEHIRANCEIFDFHLDEDDLKELALLESGMRYCAFLDTTSSKQYPFHIEY